MENDISNILDKLEPSFAQFLKERIVTVPQLVLERQLLTLSRVQSSDRTKLLLEQSLQFDFRNSSLNQHYLNITNMTDFIESIGNGEIFFDTYQLNAMEGGFYFARVLSENPKKVSISTVNPITLESSDHSFISYSYYFEHHQVIRLQMFVPSTSAQYNAMQFMQWIADGNLNYEPAAPINAMEAKKMMEKLSNEVVDLDEIIRKETFSQEQQNLLMNGKYVMKSSGPCTI